MFVKTTPRLWLAMPLLMGACNFGLDGSIIRPLDGGDERDGSESPDLIDASEPADDGEIDPAHDGGDFFADVHPPSPPPYDGSTCDAGVCTPPCSDDSECTGDTYCSWLFATCLPRCTEALGCMVRSNDTDVSTMVSDGERVYWGETPSTPGEARLFAWDLEGEPTVISSGYSYPTPSLVLDGALYFFDDERLRRVATLPDSTSDVVARYAARVWAGAAYLYWSVDKPATITQELWRVARAGGTPELLKAAEHYGFLGGDDAHVYHWEDRGPGVQGGVVVEEDVPTFSTRREVYAYQYFYGAASTLRAELAGNDVLFIQAPEFPAEPVRVDLVEEDGDLVSALYSDSTLSGFTLSDGYIYATTNLPDPAESYAYRLQVRRVRQDNLNQVQILIDVPYMHGDRSVSFASVVHGDQLVYAYDRRLFVKPLAP